jgi:uncharacterized protein YjiS (DUF1127 family)
MNKLLSAMHETHGGSSITGIAPERTGFILRCTTRETLKTERIGKDTEMTTATAARADAGIFTAGPERPLGIWTARLQATWSRRRAYRKTLAELDALTDRQLADLGATRAGLERFVRRAVYGN